jgi:hypothetical protein
MSKAMKKQMRIAECGLRNVTANSSRWHDLRFPFRTPHSAFRIGIRLALLLLALAPRPVSAQAEPLRKTDLIRYLSGGSMSTTQIAQLVQRNCVSFSPTTRDRQNLLALGADSIVLNRIDDCLQARRVAAAAASVAPPATPVATPARRPATRPSSSRRPPVVTPTPPPPDDDPVPARLVAVPMLRRVQAVVGGTANVRVALKRGVTAVSGARLVLRGSGKVAGPGSADAEAETDARGIAEFRFPAGGSAGTARLAVETVSGDPLSEAAGVELTTVLPQAPPGPSPAPRPAPDRTGFVQGTGQRGRAGEGASVPLVFEVRDSAGRAMPGLTVGLAVMNGKLAGEPTVVTTDSNGQVSLQVKFGERAGQPTVVTGSVGTIVRQAMLYPGPAAPQQLVVLLDGNAVTGQVVLSKSRTATFRIFSRDVFGNSVPVVGLKATAGDPRIVKITEVSADSLGGVITVTAGKSGMTNLMFQGSGLRQDFSAMVR